MQTGCDTGADYAAGKSTQQPQTCKGNGQHLLKSPSEKISDLEILGGTTRNQNCQAGAFELSPDYESLLMIQMFSDIYIYAYDITYNVSCI